MKKYIVVFLLALLCIPVNAQKHDVRENKVWSINITTDTCGVILLSAKAGVWNEDGSITNIIPANRKNTIIQWSWEKDPEVDLNNYRSADILSEAAQKIYYFEVLGILEKEQQLILHRYWISPFGLSNSPIPPAPLRERINGEWNADDREMLRRWFLTYHKWTAPDIWIKARTLGFKFDVQARVDIKIGTKTCLTT